MYKVIKSFNDLTDGRYTYNKGDTYPRKGLKVSDERIQELSTDANRRGEPLIKEIKKSPKKRTKKD